MASQRTAGAGRLRHISFASLEIIIIIIIIIVIMRSEYGFSLVSWQTAGTQHFSSS
jgi:hypothetical protein